MDFFDKVKTFFSIKGLAHPHVTFASMIAGIVAITQNQDDWNTLLGKGIGPRVFVLAKWFGSGCLAIAAAGRSVLSDIDYPKTGTP